MDKQLKFRWITGSFGICRLPAGDPVPEWATKGIFTSVTRTAEELSIVCLTENVPQQYKPEVSWVCLKIEGPFAFSEVGILQAFIRPLVESDIPIFTISTFDTDYILIQEPYAGVTLHALQNAGHELIA